MPLRDNLHRPTRDGERKSNSLKTKAKRSRADGVWRLTSEPCGRLYFSCGSAGKEFACSAGDRGSTPGLGRSPGEGKGYSLQYSDLENSMDLIVHGGHREATERISLH